jgi:hypothetical protein
VRDLADQGAIIDVPWAIDWIPRSVREIAIHILVEAAPRGDPGR